MLKRFEVCNYKNFQNTLVMDFSNVSGYQFNTGCIYNNSFVSKGIIYGKNAVGKTNLGRAIVDVGYTTRGGIFSVRQNQNGLINANSNEKAASFKYVFIFDKDEVTYVYKKNNKNKLLEEKLIFNDHVIYDLDFSTKTFVTDNLKLINVESQLVANYKLYLHGGNDNSDEYSDSMSFLGYLLANSAFQSESTIRKLGRFILGMRILITSDPFRYSYFEKQFKDEDLLEFQNFLAQAGIKCELIMKTLPDGEKKIFSVHKNTLLPFFDTASSGTLALIRLYINVLSRIKTHSFIYFDEFDAFYHYELSEHIIKYLIDKCPQTQIIFTTHNTNLMNNQIMRPDSLFILSSQGKVTALCDATTRELREGHNLEKLYIAGEFQKYE